MTFIGRSATLTLSEQDAAIIIRADGTVEASLPEITTEEVPENVLTGAAIVYALSNPELCERIFSHFAKECVQHLPLAANQDH